MKSSFYVSSFSWTLKRLIDTSDDFDCIQFSIERVSERMTKQITDYRVIDDCRKSKRHRIESPLGTQAHSHNDNRQSYLFFQQ